MADSTNHGEEAPRPTEIGDVIKICRELNRLGAKYLVVGGWAVIHHGYLRATEDIDLLIGDSDENQRLVRQALEVLPDKAVRQLQDDDLESYAVVRIADEVIVDLAVRISGFTYDEIEQEIITGQIEDVAIPFASADLLLRMKERTHREKDIPDRLFLERLIRERGTDGQR